MLPVFKTRIYILALLLFAGTAMVCAQESYPQDNPLVNYIMGLDEKVNNEGRYSGNTTSEPGSSLPFGIIKEIGSSRYIICIDSLRYTPQAANASAYMAIEFPGTGQKIAFAGKNIALNPKGLMPSANSRLVLASDHRIRINSRLTLVLKAMDDNYVMWDCNGFNSIKLKGYFEFKSNFIKPDPELSNDSTVTASFEVITNDIHNMVASVGITPFVLSNMSDIAFSVSNATVDFSEIANLSGMAFPPGYQLNGPPEMWTGFYLRNLTIKLPKEVSDKNQGRTTLFANNFILDNTGISGTFGATNLVSLGNGNMEGWQLSIDNISCTIAQNHLNGAAVGGKIKMPAFKNNALVYQASMMENPEQKRFDYLFAVSAQNNLSAEVFAAKIDLYPTSKLIVSNSSGKFIPSAILNGAISFQHSTVSSSKLTFQNMIIVSQAPYIQAATFALSSNSPDSNKVAKFPVTINSLGLQVVQSNPTLSANITFNLMNTEDAGLSATTGFTILSKVDPVTKDWQFDKITVNQIGIHSETSAYKLDGTITFYNNNATYGSGFGGGLIIAFGKDHGTSVTANAFFGSKEDYRYFYVDAGVSFSNPIPLGSQLGIYRFMGGLSYHMKQNGFSQTSVFPAVVSYVPDNNYGVGFKAGTTIGYLASQEAFNADVAFEMLFNTPENGGGLNTVRLEGNAFGLVNIAGRLNKTIYQVPAGGRILLSYDVPNSVFHAAIDASINTNGITGNASMAVHIDPQVKYFCIAKPSQKAIISAANIASLQAYFMTGNQLEPMAPPPYEVTSVVGTIGSQRNQTALNNTQGFVFGAEYRNSAYEEYGWDFFSVYGGISLVAGMDVMLTKYTVNCPTTGARPGVNGWYMKGQIYAALTANVGVKGTLGRSDFDFSVLSGTAAAILYAEIIRPSYIEGRIGCHYNILNIKRGTFDFDFNAGNRCGA